MGGLADLRIETIGQRPTGVLESIRLVIFLHSPIGQTFSQATWEMFDLQFSPGPAESE